MTYRVGIDVGGTFTDYVAVDAAGRVVTGKTPSTPGQEAVAVSNAIRLVADRYGVDMPQLLAATEVINFGTTVATNAILEHRGAPVGVLTTRGFRDIIDLRRGYRESLFDIRLRAPHPIARRRHRIGITERIGYDGGVIVPLAEDEVRAAVVRLSGDGISSFAICFLQSPANSIHERRCAEIVEEVHPGAVISLSSDVLNQIREFERFSTTIINAYLSPVVRDYMRRLLDDLRSQGFHGKLLVMQSNGGASTAEETGRLGACSLLSGPAGGVVAATELGAAIGHPNVIGVDMGGTSYDVSLIRGGVAQVRTDAWVARYRLALPILDIHTIGAGGGSVAWIDGGGALRVGPRSAGATPGPACYGRGGEEPTVTDANLVLGYLAADNFLGGTMTLDRGRAEAAIERYVAGPLGLGLTDAAIGIYRIVNNNMANGIRFVSVQRGHDPRDFALLAFGGAAATHAPVQARDLGIETILVPRTAGVLSALGTLFSNIKVSAMRPLLVLAANVNLDEVNSAYHELWERHHDAVSAADVRRTERRYLADFRYQGQVHELTVPVGDDAGVVRAKDWERAVSEFHRLHEQLYTFQMPGKPVEVITLREDVVGVRDPVAWDRDAASKQSESALKGIRRMCLPVDGRFEFVDASVYSGDRLAPGDVVSGPAIIEEDNTTVVLFPADRSVLHEKGIHVIQVGTEVRD